MGKDHRGKRPDRLKEFEGRLREARAGIREKEAAQGITPLGMAFRVATELVVAVLVGAAIGWGLDYWLGTAPLFMLIFFVAGAAAGVKNVVRTAHVMQADALERQRKADEENRPDGQD